MDDYLSEKEQIQRLKDWWQEYGWYLIGGMALSAIGLFAWNQYHSYERGRAVQASALYQSLQQAVDNDKGDEAAGILTQLREDYASSPYTDQASLLVAREELISSPDKAAADLRYVMQNSKDRQLALIARLRLARVLAYQKKYKQALALLDVADPGQFAARLQTIKGDINAALGNVDAARAAYTQALVAPGADLLNRNLVQMKLNHLKAKPSGKKDGGDA